jgi:hypothetical protein
VSKKGEQSVVK